MYVSQQSTWCFIISDLCLDINNFIILRSLKFCTDKHQIVGANSDIWGCSILAVSDGHAQKPF